MMEADLSHIDDATESIAVTLDTYDQNKGEKLDDQTGNSVTDQTTNNVGENEANASDIGDPNIGNKSRAETENKKEVEEEPAGTTKDKAEAKVTAKTTAKKAAEEGAVTKAKFNTKEKVEEEAGNKAKVGAKVKVVIETEFKKRAMGLRLTPLEGEIKVFYNLFTKDANEEERVQLIVDEQLSYLDPGVHNLEITSIGYRLPSIPNAFIRKHFTKGQEALTLHSLWEYCKSHDDTDTKVVYLHSKGSYHDTKPNAKLRAFLTQGALSKECSNLPDICNVCSSRMSPLPHPHTPGNMWLARCDYVAKLVDPNAKEEGKLHISFNIDDWQKGFGRYFFEHWIHSHPSVMPCDLYPGKEYTWEYKNIPDANFSMDLQMAPRFDINVYKKWGKGNEGTSVRHRMRNYVKLYNITTLDDSWWGWKSLNGKKMNSSIVIK